MQTKLLLKLIPAILSPVAVCLLLNASGYPVEDRSPAAGTLHSAGYPEQLDGPYTGGYGEQTCHTCHFDYDLNKKAGSLEVEGLGETYSPGEQIRISVTVQREHLGKAGFQLTARFADGSQAGHFDTPGERLAFTPATDDNIDYLQHSEAGTEPVSGNLARWTFKWTAPDTGAGSIIFNIAANAANGDQSEFGDWIYVKEISLDASGS
ncbi:MAG: choice-of-anchor V domain-containing protein [Balneolaceae bacterium]